MGNICFTKMVLYILANALIEYAWMHDFDKAIEVNKFLFGDCELLYYAIFTTMAEVLKLSRKKIL